MLARQSDQCCGGECSQCDQSRAGDALHATVHDAHDREESRHRATTLGVHDCREAGHAAAKGYDREQRRPEKPVNPKP